MNQPTNRDGCTEYDKDPYIVIGVLEAMVLHFYEDADGGTADPVGIHGERFWNDVTEYVHKYIRNEPYKCEECESYNATKQCPFCK